MLENELSTLGFTTLEIKVYLGLFKLGGSTANKISVETKLNRTNVYGALNKLMDKGVVSYVVKNRVKWFEAKSPSSVILLIKEKEAELKQIEKNIVNNLKNIPKADSETKNPLEASIFVGKKGLRLIFEEILEAGKPISILAAKSLQLRSFLGPYFLLWNKTRDQLRIKQRSLFPRSIRDTVEHEHSKYFSYKFLEDTFDNPTTTIIYGDICLFIQWSDEPIAIKIHNKEIARSHQNYFDALWDLK